MMNSLLINDDRLIMNDDRLTNGDRRHKMVMIQTAICAMRKCAEAIFVSSQWDLAKKPTRNLASSGRSRSVPKRPLLLCTRFTKFLSYYLKSDR